jgi:hypothetical protein
MLVSILLLLLLVPLPVCAFYESDQTTLQGFAQLSGTGAKETDFQDPFRGVGLLETRLMADTHPTPGVSLHAHLLATYQLDDKADLTTDRLNIRWRTPKTDITLGRQPINLATVFYFSPNDFFSPFSPNQFFRIYKPGVDAVRIAMGISSFSQLSLIGVWNTEVKENGPASQKEPSWLTHFSTEQWGFQWATLAGEVWDRTILGGALSGTVWEQVDLRAEGHYAWNKQLGSYAKMAVDLEHRFESGQRIRLEQYYTGEPPRPSAPFSDKNYTLLGCGYPWTPLLFIDSLFLMNQDDASLIAALYATYSITDEIEASPMLLIPVREDKGELGQIPYTVTVAIRAHF